VGADEPLELLHGTDLADEHVLTDRVELVEGGIRVTRSEIQTVFQATVMNMGEVNVSSSIAVKLPSKSTADLAKNHTMGKTKKIPRNASTG
jgi:hypothetical protein